MVSDFFSPKHLSILIESQGMVPHLFPALTLGLASLPLSVEEKWLPPGANSAVLQYSHLLPALNNEVNCKILPVDCRVGFRWHF